VSCSTGTYDCHWEPSPFYVRKFINRTLEEREIRLLVSEPPKAQSRWVQLEWCPRCRLLRLPDMPGVTS